MVTQCLTRRSPAALSSSLQRKRKRLTPPAGFVVVVALSTWSQPLETAFAKRSVSITGEGYASRECQVDGKLITAAAQELWVHQAARLLNNMSMMDERRALMAL